MQLCISLNVSCQLFLFSICMTISIQPSASGNGVSVMAAVAANLCNGMKCNGGIFVSAVAGYVYCRNVKVSILAVSTTKRLFSKYSCGYLNKSPQPD